MLKQQDEMQFRSNAARKRHQRRTHFAMSFVMIFALIGLYATNSNGTEKFDDSPLQREDSYGVSKQESLVGGNSIDEDGVGVAPPSREDTTQQAESGYDINEDELGKVKQISLLGERNSGTNWMTDELKQCFPNLTVKPRLVRWKHWFQHDDGKEHNTTLVVAQFRNPYDWIAAMQRIPHHSPLHVRLHWHEFVTKPWTMPRPTRDTLLTNITGPVCYEKFHYHQLVSCVRGHRNDTDYKPPEDGKGDFSGHQPIYELRDDGSGQPYSSIIELRADKIRNFLNTTELPWVKDLIAVQYEDLLNSGTGALLKQIEHATGEKSACAPSTSQVRRKRYIDPKFKAWITENTDWNAEKLIGYTPQL